MVTDVCVPISRLPACILETQSDLAATTVPATILGHVGDGNFHVIFSIDPTAPHEMDEVTAINRRLVERALALVGTVTSIISVATFALRSAMRRARLRPSGRTPGWSCGSTGCTRTRRPALRAGGATTSANLPPPTSSSLSTPPLASD